MLLQQLLARALQIIGDGFIVTQFQVSLTQIICFKKHKI